MTTPSAGRRGRPSVAGERSTAILDAYIGLVAETSDPGIPVREIAARANVSRTAVAHFIGSRDELVAQTIQELSGRYQAELSHLTGPKPTIDRFLDVLFGERWTAHRTDDDRAFDILRQLADRHPAARAAVHDAYSLLVRELAAAIRRSHPGVDEQEARRAAYAMTCLAEFNPFLRSVGFDTDLAASTRAAAAAVLDAVSFHP